MKLSSLAVCQKRKYWIVLVPTSSLMTNEHILIRLLKWFLQPSYPIVKVTTLPNNHST